MYYGENEVLIIGVLRRLNQNGLMHYRKILRYRFSVWLAEHPSKTG